ncbi:probable peptidyl-tRNA hydrolase 2 [Halyomorpha halys]|uniref:probable peptidyl-tRNA hydrolase 2 n=1 Tax=Halyomorpha halys TaxID=286706 RepID=UPI0006D50564|nr:probable peptidyl-tRNA hydrolase 2 [Halyomorpha halys]
MEDPQNKECQNTAVNQEYLNSLLEMGIPEDIAIQALNITNNESLEIAATQALELMDGGSDDNWEDICESFKMVFVINSELGMGVGKTAAQVAHAAVGLYKILMNKPEECAKLDSWQEEGEKKIVLRGTNEGHLKELTTLAASYNIPHYAVRDAGLTEIPANSFTVLGLFGLEEEVDKVTKKLRLL